ncbi:MAG: glutamine synthetase type III [Bacteroidetes bacterium]|uniref:Glutamine synthetase type III n=1 Tax=Phaeocystidibacter marisrubri TaxID=1577780 RepID=A0A6L3ZGY7_9FLAO|nr:glutamine synthetase III [Phaeocystidibacter marisrubri]KAB2817181.1 glutamine synthetase type III [Phaeocystidibacter marisrubri]TNE28734.1 MAG: glutamine synthetase type III [Bacteroidota bacterium]
MSTIRFFCIEETMNRKPVNFTPNAGRVSDYFGSHVFNDKSMRAYMTKEAYRSVRSAIDLGAKIDREVADQVAAGMKAWAVSKGATHYTHWFQPLTGGTAEKHDSFFEPTEDGDAIEKFSGGMLVQQEPDASSFPNGGIRNTFEARGYTAWDPTSPAFVIGTTLCIPTIFVSYTGEALDFKTPLLRALQSVDQAATDVAQYFDKNVKKVNATLGWEQEYFLVDSAFFNGRPDMALAGRALLGHGPAKGQQLDDHYFGSIPERVIQFMQEIEFEALRLGIPIKTRHNEVAPSQYEFAPIFEEANVAVDHNSLFMDLMEKVARRHNFRVLLHEKPFAGVNGSGKHNNWSLATDTGVNLLQPGKTPKSNLQFLTFFINTIKAVHDHADMLRATIASAGNDHRLGANEAPPAIISVFIGEQLSAVLDELERLESGKLSPQAKTDLKLNVVGKIPEILLDNTDRNRTSPFAFTGNKFEFRAVGSQANCAQPMTVLNAIMADQLRKFKSDVDALIKNGMKKDDAIFNVLKDYIKASKKIRFEGDGYGDAWKEEAAKRGLNNVPDTPRALDFMVTEEAIRIFEENGVLNRVEVEARHEILLEEYQKRIQIESRVLGDIAGNHVIPTAIRYQSTLIESVQRLKDLFDEKTYKSMAQAQLDMISEISKHVTVIISEKKAMIEARKKANALTDTREMAIAYCDTVKPIMETIRYHADKLELLVDDEMWPLPKFRELLFTR